MVLENKLGIIESSVLAREEERLSKKKAVVNVNLNMSKKFKIKMYILFICLLEKIF